MNNIDNMIKRSVEKMKLFFIKYNFDEIKYKFRI